MTDRLTTAELQTWLGISAPTIVRLRNRPKDPLPAPVSAYDQAHGHLYDRAAITNWLKTNPAYPKEYQSRKGKAMVAAAKHRVPDAALAMAFLTGRV